MEKYICEKCGKQLKKRRKTGLCKECLNKQKRKDNQTPSKQQLLKDKQQLCTLKNIGLKYSKSWNTVWRWFKQYDIKTEKINKQYMWFCQTCNQYFRTRPELLKHKSIHPHICKYCGKEFENGCKLGGHIRLCKLNPIYEERIQKIKQNQKIFFHSKQTKQKLHQIRKQYFLNHPQNIFWKKNDKFITPPCQQFKRFLNQNKIIFEAEYMNPQEFKNRLFALDIAIPNKKIDIQINGKQHYIQTHKLTKYYQQRHDIIKQAGWIVLQIPNRLSYSLYFRQMILKYLTQNNQETLIQINKLIDQFNK